MSVKHEIFELMHAEIDGVATEAQRARLQTALADSPEAREEYARLQGVTRLLAEVKSVEPPAHLTADVMRAIRNRRHASGGGWIQRLRDLWPGGRVALPYAYAAAAGAAIGILGLQVLTGSRTLGPDMFERDAAATIGTLSGIPAGRTELTGTAVRGSASVRRLDGSLALDVDLTSQGPVDVSLAFDPAAAQFLGISNRTGGADRIQIADGTIRWSQSRSERVTVLFAPRRGGSSRIEVGISGRDGIAGHGTVELPARN